MYGAVAVAGTISVVRTLPGKVLDSPPQPNGTLIQTPKHRADMFQDSNR